MRLIRAPGESREVVLLGLMLFLDVGQEKMDKYSNSGRLLL